jgi:hypothetical protein
VIATGATQIRAAFTADEIPGIVIAYMEGIKVALAIPIGATGIALLASLFSSWKRSNGETVQETGGAV